MSTAQDQFRNLLRETLIPDFAGAPDRNMTPASFRWDSLGFSEHDAAAFMRAWNAGMLSHYERGRYRFRESGSIEQFFSSGPKAETPRSFSLWLEPLIAVGTMHRLSFEFGWPENLIATQSSDGAFDVIAFRQSRENEFIAGEVKKSQRETERLIELMRNFGSNPEAGEPRSGPTRNAFKKVAALRRRKPPIFWAIGPGGLSYVFSVEYGPNEKIELKAIKETSLAFAG